MRVGEFHEAIRLDPNDPYTHNNLGLAYQQTDRLDAAIQEFLKAIDLDPNDAHVHYNLGSTYARAGKLQDAQNEFNVSLQLEEQQAATHFELGKIYGRRATLPRPTGSTRKPSSWIRRWPRRTSSLASPTPVWVASTWR